MVGEKCRDQSWGMAVREFVGGTWKLRTEATEEQRALAG